MTKTKTKTKTKTNGPPNVFLASGLLLTLSFPNQISAAEFNTSKTKTKTKTRTDDMLNGFLLFGLLLQIRVRYLRKT